MRIPASSRKHEYALRDSEAQWKAVFEHNPTMYFMVDAAGPGGIPVSERVPASERTRQRIEALLAEGVEGGDVRSELVRLGVRKLVEEGLEGEVEDELGRASYRTPSVGGRC